MGFVGVMLVVRVVYNVVQVPNLAGYRVVKGLGVGDGASGARRVAFAHEDLLLR